jgi:hypothetical protein
MHGHEQNLQRMMMKIGKVIIVTMPFLQDLSQAIVKVTVDVKAVPKKTANVKSKAIHARDHWKREQEKKFKKAAAKLKNNNPKKSILQGLCLPQGILFQQQ